MLLLLLLFTCCCYCLYIVVVVVVVVYMLLFTGDRGTRGQKEVSEYNRREDPPAEETDTGQPSPGSSG